jgi:hypothetical protein
MKPEPIEWMKIMNDVERMGLDSMDDLRLHSILDDLESNRKERLKILEARKVEQVKLRRRRIMQESAKMKIIESNHKALIESHLREKAVKLKQWHDKLKERDMVRASEKRKLLSMLQREQERLAESRRQPIPGIRRATNTNSDPFPIVVPVLGTQTPPLTGRTTMSFFARLATPRLERTEKVTDPFTSAMKESTYARNTKLASSVYCRKANIKK